MSFRYIEMVGTEGYTEVKVVDTDQENELDLSGVSASEPLSDEASNYFRFLEDHRNVEGLGLPVMNICTTLRALLRDATQIATRRMRRDYRSALVQRQADAPEAYSSDPDEVIERLRNNPRFRYLKDSITGPMLIGSGEMMHRELVSFFRDMLYNHLISFKENAKNN